MKIKKIILAFFVFALVILFNNICFAKDLDQINKYYITVDPRNDGTLDMAYHIEWEVLDSTSEGPLTWVQIGIPNSYVDSIKSTSSEVKSVRYYENNGTYIRVDFKKSYNAGDIVKFDFTFHQKYMYELDYSYCTYNFTPGWFNDIAVNDLKVYWNAEKVTSSTAEETNSDNYLVWSGRLAKGAKLKTKVEYPKSAFKTLNENQQFSNANTNYNESSTGLDINTIFVIIFFIIIFISMLSSFSGAGYNRHSGYGYGYGRPYYHHHHHQHHSSCASRSSCVSSCACACACAGGGRAGCSKKDFYGTNLRTNNIKKVLNNKKA